MSGDRAMRVRAAVQMARMAGVITFPGDLNSGTSNQYTEYAVVTPHVVRL